MRSSLIFSYSIANSSNHFRRSPFRSNFRIDVATAEIILVACACNKINRTSHDDDDLIDKNGDSISNVADRSTSDWIASPIIDFGACEIPMIG